MLLLLLVFFGASVHAVGDRASAAGASVGADVALVAVAAAHLKPKTGWWDCRRLTIKIYI